MAASDQLPIALCLGRASLGTHSTCAIDAAHAFEGTPSADESCLPWHVSGTRTAPSLPSAFLFDKPSEYSSFVDASFKQIGYQIIKVRKDGDYHWYNGEIMPLGAPCLIKRAIYNKQLELDKIEAEIEAERNKERGAQKKEKEYVAVAKANANLDFPYRMPDKQEAANAGQANAEVAQDVAIQALAPLLKKKKIIVEELDKLEQGLEGKDPKDYKKKKGGAGDFHYEVGPGGKKVKKKGPKKPRFRPDMLAAEEEPPSPGAGGGGVSVILPDASTPAPPGMAAVQVLNVGSKAPEVTEGGAYEPQSGTPEANGGTFVSTTGPTINVGSRSEDADLEQPQEAPDESLMPLPPLPVLAPILALLPKGPAAMAVSRIRHSSVVGAEAWRVPRRCSACSSRLARRRPAAVFEARLFF